MQRSDLAGEPVHAVWYDRYGPPTVLQYGARLLPEPIRGQVRLRMHASALAQIDVKMRSGLLQSQFTPPFPKIPGRDGVGVVERVGPGVERWKPGDEACVLISPLDAGTAATHVVCDAARMVRRPAGLSLAQAAALLQPGVGAWSAVQAASLQSGMRVLVHGASGAVGALVLQQARALGAHVTATCHHDHCEHTLAQGAHQVIAYDREDFDHLRGLDVVFDFVGGSTHARSYPLLQRGGAIVYLMAEAIQDRGVEHGVRVVRAVVTDAPDAIQAVAHLASTGVYRPLVARQMPLADAAAAHAALEAGGVRRGRVVFLH